MDDDAPRPRPSRRDVAIVAALISGLFLFLVGPVVAMPFTPDHTTMDHASGTFRTAQDGPFTLDGVPANLVALYHDAAEHQPLYANVPCYCGCFKLYDHRDLARCFVRPDGRWERHAAGCFTCAEEAEQVRSLNGLGRSPDEIRAAVIAKYGPPPATTATSEEDPS